MLPPFDCFTLDLSFKDTVNLVWTYGRFKTTNSLNSLKKNREILEVEVK